jgi:hypothetical protein
MNRLMRWYQRGAYKVEMSWFGFEVTVDVYVRHRTTVRVNTAPKIDSFQFDLTFRPATVHIHILTVLVHPTLFDFWP